MNSDKSEFQEVLVDVPKYDKDGNPISPDSLSSGGARNRNGALIAQYCNPRPPESANEPEFDERRNRELEASCRRSEAAEERRRKEHEDFLRGVAIIIGETVVTPLIERVIIPQATKLWDTKVLPGGKRLWDTKVLPGGKRLAQGWLRPKRSQPEVPHESGDTPEFAAETAVAQIKTELKALLADEVQNRQHRFAPGAAQPASQLLEEDCGTLRGPDQQDGVHLWQVQPFVEKVNGEDAGDFPLPQAA